MAANDKQLTQILMNMGLNWEKSREIVGMIIEERQVADREGYKRGFNDGAQWVVNNHNNKVEEDPYIKGVKDAYNDIENHRSNDEWNNIYDAFLKLTYKDKPTEYERGYINSFRAKERANKLRAIRELNR